VNYIPFLQSFKKPYKSKKVFITIKCLFIVLLGFCIANDTNAQENGIAKKSFSINEVQEIKKIMETANTHLEFVVVNELLKKEIQNFYTIHQITEKVANKLNTLLLVVFNQSISIQDRLLVCDFLIYSYAENRDFFPVEMLEKERILLSQIKSKN
jgi:hypothetical protein